MRVWTMAAQKGGCGKSTLATQLAVYAEKCGEMTLILDLDPQGSIGAWQQRRMTNAPMVAETEPDHLEEIIEGARKIGTSLVILDTPPHTNKIASVAMRLADLIICPSQSSMFDLASLRDTVNLLNMANAIDKAVGVVNFVPPHEAKQAYDEAVGPMSSFGLSVIPSYVTFRRAFPKSLQLGKGVVETEPKGKAAAEVMAVWGDLNKLCPLVEKAKKKKAVTA